MPPPQPIKACNYMYPEELEKYDFFTFFDQGTKVVKFGSVKWKMLFSKDTLSQLW